MKRRIKILLTSIMFTGLLFFSNSCVDLEVENLMAPDREEALATSGDLMSLLDGGYNRVFWGFTTFRNFHIDAWADQGSVTNAWSGFWFFAEEPRNRIPNATTWSDRTNIEDPWGDFNAGVSVANTIINIVEVEGNEVVDEETDVDYTDVTLASAYFLKGISQGYLGMTFDKGYVVDPETDLTALEFVDYSVLIEEAVKNLKYAWEYAEAHPFDDWRFMVGQSTYTSAEFVKIAKSYAARIAAGEARNSTQSAALDWQQIYNWADAGITEDFSPLSSTDWWQQWHDWQCYFMGMKAPYLQVDIKIPYYFTKYFPEDEANMYSWEDNDYPWEYPTDESIVLGPAASKDQRLGPRVTWYENEGTADEVSYWGQPTGEDTWEQVDPATLSQLGYFVYTSEFGYLNASRGRHLFSNYAFIRFQERYWPQGEYNQGGHETHLMLKWEMDLLKAEAQMQLSGEAAGRDVLNNASPNPREEVGGLSPLDGTYPLAEMIEYEYAIELYGTAKYLNWISMRRWDRLKKGTPLSIPVPASELQTTGEELYSFGGAAYADGEGTADGSNEWAPNH